MFSLNHHHRRYAPNTALVSKLVTWPGQYCITAVPEEGYRIFLASTIMAYISFGLSYSISNCKERFTMYLRFFSRSIHDGNNLLAGTVYIQAQVKIEAYQLSNFPHHIIGNPKCDRAHHHHSFFRSVLPPREDHFRTKVVLL